MYWRDHEPAHFHAKYGEEEVVVEIKTGEITGNMSKRGLAMVEEWRKIHVNELLLDWKRAKENKPLLAIKPLE